MYDDRPSDDPTLDEPPPIDGGSISGMVTDFQNVPLVGVRVEAASTAGGELDLLPVMTDGEGAFELPGLSEGRYDLRFSLGKVRARTLAVPVGTDQLRVNLARPQGILLKIRTESGRTPADLYSIVLEREGPRGLVREWFGRTLKPSLLLWSIRPGRYRVIVWGGGYLPVDVHGVRVVEECPAPEVEVLLAARGSTIDGHIANAPADVLVGWRRVDAPGHHPPPLASVGVDPEGRFFVRGLPAGTYRLWAWAQQRPIVETVVEIGEEETRSVCFEF